MHKCLFQHSHSNIVIPRSVCLSVCLSVCFFYLLRTQLLHIHRPCTTTTRVVVCMSVRRKKNTYTQILHTYVRTYSNTSIPRRQSFSNWLTTPSSSPSFFHVQPSGLHFKLNTQASYVQLARSLCVLPLHAATAATAAEGMLLLQRAPLSGQIRELLSTRK